MKVKQFLEIAISSFFSKAIYQEACFKWQGYAMSYLFGLLLFSSLPSLFTNLYYINSIDINKINSDEYHQSDDINSFIGAIINQLPTIKINNGIASSITTDGVKIKIPNTNKLLAIIDTSGQTKSIESSENAVLITANNLIIQIIDSNGKPSITEYPLTNIFRDSEEIILDRNELINLLAKIKRISLWAIPLIYLPAVIFFGLIYAVIKFACYGIVGWGYIKFVVKKNAHFSQIFRLAVLAASPPVIIGTLFSLIASQNILIAKFSYYFVLFASFAYFIFAIKSCLEKEIKC